jgi:hypothetical protein
MAHSPPASFSPYMEALTTYSRPIRQSRRRSVLPTRPPLLRLLYMSSDYPLFSMLPYSRVRLNTQDAAQPPTFAIALWLLLAGEETSHKAMAQLAKMNPSNQIMRGPLIASTSYSYEGRRRRSGTLKKACSLQAGEGGHEIAEIGRSLTNRAT